ncbi:HAF repeat-containing protein [Actinosynnema sp. NPDC047251]|uniref:Extracellular repeat protein, HAF family n=1 Tax=Saccharothrix espanaensis (strain ATCC 51144 / DSM 44229 / JCM 9112 / NBRC 15066 / NRRL 15764) TaxID=1179773 RepID=K0JYW4_SACES|nr:HAF repeat-containing protein [Saccharothrix espanaensis]CCH33120.1 Extracellular repeat protein, HAF family [Saccharothrix espanaensis DSM 44229]
MPHKRVLVPLLLAAALPLALATPAEAAAPRVTITELPALAGGTARVVGLNDNGEVAGTNSGSTGSRAVLWNGGAPVDLGRGNATAISARGQVLSLESMTSGGTYQQHPRIWHAGTTTNLAPSGSGWVIANAINATGDVPITYSRSPYGYHQEAAAVWKTDHHVGLSVSGPHLSISVITDNGLTAGTQLPMFGDDKNAFRCQETSCTRLAAAPGTGPYAVVAANESGVIVGNRDNRPLRWQGDAVTVLPGGVGAVASSQQAVNERGHVVGWTQDASGVRRATVWRGGRQVVLNVPGPSEALAINDKGDIIGYSSASGQQRAFLWRNGRAVELGTLGGTHSVPVAINNNGVVIGHSTTADGSSRAVKWTVRKSRSATTG